MAGLGCTAGVLAALLRQPKTALWLPALLSPSAAPWARLAKSLALFLLLSLPQWGWECSLLAWGSGCALGSALRASGFLSEKQEFETDRKGRGFAYVPLIALRCSGAGYSGFGC